MVQNEQCAVDMQGIKGIHHPDAKKDYIVQYFEGANGRASVLCFMLAKANVNWEKEGLTM